MSFSRTKKKKIVLILATTLGAVHCAAFRDDPATLLAHGRAVEARDQLRQEEPDAKHYPRPQRARYALYRGLSHLALDDTPAATRWLGEAKQHFDADPRCLSTEDAGRLLNAWQSLGRGL